MITSKNYSDKGNHAVNQSKLWQQLLIKKTAIEKIAINQLFIDDVNRFKNFALQADDLNILYDFSKQHINLPILTDLLALANHCELYDKIQDLLNGRMINITENKLVAHIKLRDPNSHAAVAASLEQIAQFIQKLYDSNFTDILCLGIGGSYLGPMFISDALDQYGQPIANKFKLHFLANHDLNTIDTKLSKLNPQQTIIIISSKTFTTAETINNAKIVINWLQQSNYAGNDLQYLQQIFAITANAEQAIKFGIMPENIFSFEDTVGGRYSIWSAISIPCMLKIGIANFKQFLHGAYLVDQHFKQQNFIQNIPVMMGLISIWNINFMQYKSLAIISYLDALANFYQYLQQLSMESNGKNINLANQAINYDTGELIFGGLGCNVQHSFMQMLHQGTQIIPVDFLVAAKGTKFLFANCIAQSYALMQGNSNIDLFKQCKGNRPNSMLLFPELTPTILGSLIALYEHKVFVQSVIWNINPFDQWGVELGKSLATQVLMQLTAHPANQHHDNNYKNIDNNIQHNCLENSSSILPLITIYNQFKIS